MDSLVSLLKDTPIPTILVVSGIVFLFLALAGQVAGKLEVPPARQKWAAAAGAVFLGAGLLLYLAPGLPRPTLAEGTLPTLELPAATQAQAPQGAQDAPAEQGGLASPTASGVTAGSAVGEGEDCLQGVFSGIAADRVVRVESGKRGKELLAAHQTKKEPAGLILLELGQPVAALTYYFLEEDQLFKIGAVVDGACQPMEYENAARGGDRSVLQNWDWLDIPHGTAVYTLRFGFYGGVVSLDTSKSEE